LIGIFPLVTPLGLGPPIPTLSPCEIEVFSFS